MKPLLGTFVEIGVDRSNGQVDAGIDAGFAAIEKVHELASFQDPDSQLSLLNRAQGQEVGLHPLLLRLLRLSRAMTSASRGLFNCTVGGALVRRGILPDHGFERDLADSGTAADLVLGRDRARLTNRIAVTLDGLGKGFAVDLAVAAMKRRGVQAGWVNAGGDVRAFGEMTLPIYRREMDGKPRTLGGLRNSAIATSRVGEHDPRFPGHIVSGGSSTPKPGVWSVVAPTAWRADALTKVASLAQGNRREAILADLKGILA